MHFLYNQKEKIKGGYHNEYKILSGQDLAGHGRQSDPAKEIWHWGVRCYASCDLYNWEDKGIIIPPEPDDETSSLHPTSYMDRPHIIYNARTKKFVCWLKIMNKDNTQSETVLTADHILGPYTKVREGLRPLGMSAGDFDLAVADDGKAYYFFERVHSETIIADTWHGPYTVQGNPHVNDPTNTSFHSQISSVFKVQGKKDLYIAAADRWLPLRFEGDRVYIDWKDEWSLDEYEDAPIRTR